MKIEINTEDPKSFDTIIKSLPSGKIKVFGLEWGICRSNLSAPFEATLTLFSNNITDLEAIEKK